MSKKQLSSLFAKTASMPSIEERLQMADQEPAQAPAADNESVTNPVNADTAGAPVRRYQTGAGAATYATRLEEQLKKAISEQAAIRIPVDSIDPNPWQPRIKFDQDALKTLAASIAMGGVMAPIAVRRHPENPDRYQLIAGERRWRATKMAEKSEIPAVLLHLTDAETAANALAENLLRENLTDYEISRAMRSMEKQFPSKAQMSETFGVGKSQLYRLLSFDKLPTFLIENLDDEPGLIGSKVLPDLLSLFEGWPEAELEKLVKPALIKRQKGLINQVELVKEVEKALTPVQSRTSTAKSRQVLMKQGKRVGTLIKDSDVLSLKLKLADISTDQQVALITFIQSQFNMKP